MTATLARPYSPRMGDRRAPPACRARPPRNPRLRNAYRRARRPAAYRPRPPHRAIGGHCADRTRWRRLPVRRQAGRNAQQGRQRSSSTAARASRPARRTAPCFAARRTSCSTAPSRSRPYLRAKHVTVAVHDAEAAASVSRAVAQRTDAGHVHVERVFGGFVAGEARALMRGLRGDEAIPPGRRVHLTEQGVLLSNVETFAQVAVALRLGAHRLPRNGHACRAGHDAAHDRWRRGPSRCRRDSARDTAGHRAHRGGSGRSAGRDHRRLPRHLARDDAGPAAVTATTATSAQAC